MNSKEAKDAERKGGEMSDIEVTRLCADAMEFKEVEFIDHLCVYRNDIIGRRAYQPLINDGQAMELVKKFRLRIIPSEPPYHVNEWCVINMETGQEIIANDLNVAICRCVAKMQASLQERAI